MRQKIKLKFIYILGLFLLGTIPIFNYQPTNAETCPDLKVIFARGSGGSWNEDANYLAFKNSIESKLKTTSIDYEIMDLAYPAVAVGLDNFWVSLGALVSSGDAYTFGDSVNTGVKMMADIINGSTCSNTRYVIGGYSQGAMVVSKTLHSISSDKLIYAATFGDPKLYLPEGEGIIPAACKNENLSDYRAYVPDCYAYEGLLGSYQPYEPYGFEGKVGTWCNKSDLFCSSHWSLQDHLDYTTDELYEDASKVIFDKITAAFGIENNYTSPHDTAILIDSTGSMSSMIEKYKTEALRLAKETLESGGRVALYDYRDLQDPYEPVEHCNFETCTLEIIEAELNNLNVRNGGDTPESLLSASFNMMKELQWKYGATKSVVVLTDANYHSPDIDGTTLDQVVKLSQSIDPVNFYIITIDKYADTYAELATQTDGKVVTNFNELSLLTDLIMERYDSLPVVETEITPETLELPTLNITSSEQISSTSLKITFETDAEMVLISLNDAILGTTTAKEITLTDLDPTITNQIRLTPIKNENRGQSQEISLPAQIIPTVPQAGIPRLNLKNMIK